MKREDYEKAVLLSSKINKLNASISEIKAAVYVKEQFDKDCNDGKKPSFWKSWAKKFCDIFIEEKPTVRMHYELARPITIELENDEFVKLLICHMEMKLRELQREFDDL
jgi:D-Tyr-tRNAtyr deacylase